MMPVRCLPRGPAAWTVWVVLTCAVATALPLALSRHPPLMDYPESSKRSSPASMGRAEAYSLASAGVLGGLLLALWLGGLCHVIRAGRFAQRPDPATSHNLRDIVYLDAP